MFSVEEIFCTKIQWKEICDKYQSEQYFTIKESPWVAESSPVFMGRQGLCQTLNTCFGLASSMRNGKAF